MPPIERSGLVDKAVLWPVRPGQYHEDGQPVLGDPVEIDCKWVEGRKESGSPQLDGNIEIDAWALVDRKIAIGSGIWKGEMADWVGTGPPADSNECMRVAGYRETWDSKGREAERKIDMRRANDLWPSS
ncbi:MAG TPA: hypothetical protein VD932_02605 [Aquabacterium sp.]|nr:hypothetical protein [Aquabacterium sp.]